MTNKKSKLSLGKLKISDLDSNARKRIIGGDTQSAYATCLGCGTLPATSCDTCPKQTLDPVPSFPCDIERK